MRFQPDWLDAAYAAIQTRGPNYQRAVGLKLALGGDREAVVAVVSQAVQASQQLHHGAGREDRIDRRDRGSALVRAGDVLLLDLSLVGRRCCAPKMRSPNFLQRIQAAQIAEKTDNGSIKRGWPWLADYSRA